MIRPVDVTLALPLAGSKTKLGTVSAAGSVTRLIRRDKISNFNIECRFVFLLGWHAVQTIRLDEMGIAEARQSVNCCKEHSRLLQ